MKYIKKLENEAAYQEFKNSEDYVTPNLVWCVQEDVIKSNATPPAELEPLKFTVLQGSGTISFQLAAYIYDSNDEPAIDYVEWSTDGENWNRTKYDIGGNLIETKELQERDVCYFRGSARTYGSYNNSTYSYFLLSAGGGSGSGSGSGGETTIENIKVEGNIMSLLGTDTFEEGENSIFYSIFSNCNVLSDASDLVLPATTLAQYCYYSMFYNCTSLTTAPATLPATTLATHCYDGMFNDCTSLTTASILPATTLADYCYSDMFSGCIGLNTAPVLPATTLAIGCYSNMFYSCTGLNTAPELPATVLVRGCYNSMFSGCIGLNTAPVLPATTLAIGCYSNMFYSCTGLNTASILPATTLADYCYSDMFSGCIGLNTAPVLPATTLAIGCYSNMFYSCTGLNTAPELPATVLVRGCYNSMFSGCNNLNYIKCLATDISATDSTKYWVQSVAPTGTFIKDPNMSSWTTDANGIPSGWSVTDYTD